MLTPKRIEEMKSMVDACLNSTSWSPFPSVFRLAFALKDAVAEIEELNKRLECPRSPRGHVYFGHEEGCHYCRAPMPVDTRVKP